MQKGSRGSNFRAISTSTKLQVWVQENNAESGQRAGELAEDYMATQKAEDSKKEDAEREKRRRKSVPERKTFKKLEERKAKEVKESLAFNQTK